MLIYYYHRLAHKHEPGCVLQTVLNLTFSAQVTEAFRGAHQVYELCDWQQSGQATKALLPRRPTQNIPPPSPRQPTSQVFTGSSSLSPPTIKILIRILSSSASTVPAGGKVVEHLFTLGWSQTKLASTMPDHMFPDHTFSNGAAWVRKERKKKKQKQDRVSFWIASTMPLTLDRVIHL